MAQKSSRAIKRNALELKQRVIVVLNKLGDRDTYQIAAEELGRIAQTLGPEELGPFLSCLFETDSQQKSSVRRECVKVFATLGDAHGEVLGPHLPKMVGNIIRRLKDPHSDSSVRDACVDAMGALASSRVDAMGVFVRPLLEALGEQNRQLQTASALCLARVIQATAASSPPSHLLPALHNKTLLRILKLLSNNSFSPNAAALLSVIASIVQVGGASSPQILSVVVPCMLETLRSNDWTTRKAAAEAFACMALSLGPVLSSFKSSCIAALEACRFDKVKPVRDTIVQTLQAWKSIRDAEASSPQTESKSLKTGTEKKSEETFTADVKSYISVGQKSKFLRKSGGAVTKSMPDSVSFRTVKRRTPLTDKKMNLGLPQKMDCRKNDIWHIEVAVPKTSPPISVINSEKFSNIYSSEVSKVNETIASNKSTDDGLRFHDTEIFRNTESSSRLSDESRSSCETKCILVDKPSKGARPSTDRTPDGSFQPIAELSSPHNTCSSHDTPFEKRNNGNCKPIAELCSPHNTPFEKRNNDKECSDSLTTETMTGSSTNFGGGFKSCDADDLAFIRKQLFQIDNQQSNLMELLQVFMGSSLDSVCTLETRVHGLQRIIYEMAQDLAAVSRGRSSCVEGGTGNKHCCCTSVGAEMVRSKLWKINEGAGAGVYPPSPSPSRSPSRPFGSSSDTVLASSTRSKSVQEGSYKCEFGTKNSWENSTDRHMQSGFKVKPLVDDDATWEMSFREGCSENDSPPSDGSQTQRVTSNNERLVSQSLPLDKRSSWVGNSGKEYSIARDRAKIRSWLTFKDEASCDLSGTYLTREDTSPMMSVTRNYSVLNLPGKSSSIRSSYENGRFWSVWRRVVEYLCAKDVDSAYVEVLCSGDGLLLIQLMKRTGPVLESLSQGTVVEILQTVMGLLLELKFLDIIIPWLQQVADFISSNGPDYLGLSRDKKVDILCTLQEASCMHFSQISSRMSVTQLASKLADVWATDLKSI